MFGFKSNYFCNVAKSGWFWKQLSRMKVPINHFLKSLKKQPYADVLHNRFFRNFLIFTGKRPCWSLFLIKLQTLWPASIFKGDFSTGVFFWILQNVLIENSSGICWSSFLNQKQCGMVSPKRGKSGDSMHYLHISRNHSNMLLLFNMQKPKTFRT